MSREIVGSSSPARSLMAIGLFAVLFAAFLLSGLPARIADLGSGGLTGMMRPVYTVKYGETVRLAGRNERPPLEISVDRPYDVRRTRHRRMVAVPLRIRNTGTREWTSADDAEIGLFDSAGENYAPLPRKATRVQGALRQPLEVRPDTAHSGLLVFAVPRRVKVAGFRLTVGVGITRTGEWVERPSD